MDLDQVAKDFHSIWEKQPLAIILLVVGFVVFVIVVVDAWRHKRRRRKPRLH